MNLWKYFLENDGNKITRWTHYFPIYEKHFERFRNKPIKVKEIAIDDLGQPTINGTPILKFRLPKLMGK